MLIEEIHSLSSVRFGQLMEVYLEGNLENGRERYPFLSPSEQLLSAEQDFYQYLSEFFRTSGSFYLVLSQQERYLTALRMEPYKDGLLLEALETRPEERRKGYASELLLRCRKIAAEQATKIYSHISKRNLPSIAVHERCGFRRILDYAVYVDGSVNDRAYTYCLDIE